jgi:hypothetical protein
MPLRLLNRCLLSVPGFDAGVTKLAMLCPALFVVVGMILRGAVLLHPRDTFAAYPNAYRVFLLTPWTDETLMGWAELSGGLLLLIGGLYVRLMQGTKSQQASLVLRWVQLGFFIAMIMGGGLGGMMAWADWLNPGWCWFFGRSFMAGVVVLQLCSEIDFLDGRERRFAERRLFASAAPSVEQLRGLSDEQLRQSYLHHYSHRGSLHGSHHRSHNHGDMVGA